ncbi:hypothetical protein GLV98_13935 [Halobacillus litoralis]|uniref:DUF3794 domain-containing protein n=1 Tax=Halobacillus litoralis TaxID=45668 RepID=A0A845E4A9_9BACI|nr:hypothetical protein [Halobacillus litoralis]MYL50594.1 hypothetical protein [Halobacillus litoralis]
MDPNIDLSRFRRECIDTNKVFDYVIARGTDVQELTLGGITQDVIDGICEALTAGGTVQNVEVEIDFGLLPVDDTGCTAEGTEMVPLDDGEEIELTLVTVTKSDTIPINITFDVFESDGVTPVYVDVEATAEIDGTAICEEPVLLCCPDQVGSEISCRVLPTSTFRLLGTPTCVDGDGDGALDLLFNLLFTLCQEVQCSAPVKLEVFARPCEPRPLIPLGDCRQELPNPCRRIFPVMDEDDNGNG